MWPNNEKAQATVGYHYFILLLTAFYWSINPNGLLFKFATGFGTSVSLLLIKF